MESHISYLPVNFSRIYAEHSNIPKGLCPATVIRMLYGEFNMKLSKADEIARAYNVNLVALLTEQCELPDACKDAKACYFAECMMHCREAIGMSRKDLAKALHVNKSSIANWETFNNTPSLDVVQRLADVLGVQVVMLFMPVKED